MDRREIEDYIKNNPGDSRAKLAKRFKIHESAARRIRDKVLGKVRAIKRSSTVKPRGVALGAFRDALDVPHIIRQHTKDLSRSEAYADADFRDLCGVNSGKWRAGADLEEFARFQFSHKGRMYWAHPSFVEKIELLKRGRWDDGEG